jgi:hypothetical protein
VVTTRRRDSALDGNRRRLIEVGLFSAAEARRYLTEKLSRHGHPADGVAELAADLGFLPLLLAGRHLQRAMVRASV